MGTVGLDIPFLYLDTNVFIHAVEGMETEEPCQSARKILTAARQGRVRCTTSELTLAEVLAPTQKQVMARPQLERAYAALLVHANLVTLEPLVRDDMYESAKIADYQKKKVKLTDRLHLSVAVRLGTTHFVSFDADIRCPQGMEKLDLSERDLSNLLT